MWLRWHLEKKSEFSPCIDFPKCGMSFQMAAQQDVVARDEAEERLAAYFASVIQRADYELDNARHCKILEKTKADGRLHGLTNRQQRDLIRKQARESAKLRAYAERELFF